MNFFQKRLDKIFWGVFHRLKIKNKKITLENIGFSILSTEFSIGFEPRRSKAMENFLKNQICDFCRIFLKKEYFFAFKNMFVGEKP